MNARVPVLPVLAFLAGKLIALMVNVVLFPTLRAGPGAPHRRSAGSGPAQPGAVRDRSVALLIPVRDEVRRLPATLPGLLGAGASSVTFLDDGSTDGTAELIREMTTEALLPVSVVTGALLPVSVVTGAPRPEGWVGKTWACAQLAAATDAELLVYCDADVRLAPGALAALKQEMDRQGADVFSVFCTELTGGFAERLLVPLIEDVLLCFLPFPLLRAPAPAAATANGALLAFRRPAYRALGGFEAVRGELVEDVAMARRTRRLGLRLGLALGGEVARVRMYTGYREIIAGLGRGLRPVVGGGRWPVLAGLAWHLLCYTLPPLLMRRGSGWRAAALMGILERLIVELKTGRHDWPSALFVCLSPIAAIPVVAQSMRRAQVWKGRVYS